MPYGVVILAAALSRENCAADSLIASSSATVQSRNVVSSRGTNTTWPIGIACDPEIPSPGSST